MDVLDHHHQRRVSRQSGEQPEEQFEQPALSEACGLSIAGLGNHLVGTQQRVEVGIARAEEVCEGSDFSVMKEPAQGVEDWSVWEPTGAYPDACSQQNLAILGDDPIRTLGY
jgi:hypothetical protein